MTIYWTIDPTTDPDSPALQEAAARLRMGGLVAFPTETVYGLGADARNTEAVDAIFRSKGRPSDNPLIVHIADRAQLDGLIVDPDKLSLRLMDAFWPGPLTLVLPVRPGAVSPRVTAGLDTVAVRMPAHPVALALIRAAGCPVAAPSANRSGRPSPTRAAHVRDDLDGAIDGVVDGGPTSVGLESTVVEAAGGVVHVLRPGGVSMEALRRAVPGATVTAAAADAAPADGIGKSPGSGLAPGEGVSGSDKATGSTGTVDRHTAAASPAGGDPAEGASAASGAAGTIAAGLAGASDEPASPRSPGMKYAHYAPRGLLTLVQGPPDRMAAWIRAALESAKAAGERTGVLAAAERAALYRDAADHVAACGSLADPASTARGLFDALRGFDEAGATYILAEAFDEAGIGLAVMNRLRKAAGGRIANV